MLVAYPQPGKLKASLVCKAFAAGAGGRVVTTIPRQLLPGAAAFYGVRPDWLHLWNQAKAEGRDWFYIDNGYFGSGTFRVARNAVQAAQQQPDRRRLEALGVRIAPWRREGNHILVCPQSPEFMATVAGIRCDWPGDVTTMLRMVTDRPVRVRFKGDATPLAADLAGCWCVVAWSSNAAVEAIRAGIPAIVMGESAAAPMAGSQLAQIHAPPTPDGREEWAAGLAASQWSLEEMKSGKAWGALHGC